MNAPEMIRLHDGLARAVENMAALYFAYGVETLAELSAAIFLEFESSPALEVVKHDGAVVKAADLCYVDTEDAASLLVCHEGRLPYRLDLTAYATPAEAVLAFGRMAEGLHEGEVEA